MVKKVVKRRVVRLYHGKKNVGSKVKLTKTGRCYTVVKALQSQICPSGARKRKYVSRAK